MRLPKEAKYPTSIEVDGEDYRIIFVDQIEGNHTLGLCDPGNRTIQLARGQKPKELLATFIHEVLHAIEFERDLTISHKNVEELAQGLTAILLENF